MAALVPPDIGFEASYRAAMAEFAAEGRDDEVGRFPQHASFAAFVRELHEQAAGRGLPNGWVAGTTFWLVDDEVFVGKVDVRHSLTPELRLRGGHVGYAIRPTMRRRGYGRRALALVLPRCRDLGLDRVLVTCDATNEASRRIIEANGGELEDEVQMAGRAVATRRYWIDIPRQHS